MSARALEYDEWGGLVRLLRSYCRRKYDTSPVALTIHFEGDGVNAKHHEPIPATDPRPEPHEDPPASVKEWATGDAPKHSDTFEKIYWPSLGTFRLTPKQRAIVATLWRAMESGTYDVGQATLLRIADSDCPRLHDLFFRSRSWKTLVVRGVERGTFRLPTLPKPTEAEAGANADHAEDQNRR